MKITFDPPKRLRTLLERGLDFAAIDLEFFDAALIREAKKGRFMAIGELEGELIAVIFAPLGSEAISIVSMRLASREERNLYAKTRKADPSDY